MGKTIALFFIIGGLLYTAYALTHPATPAHSAASHATSPRGGHRRAPQHQGNNLRFLTTFDGKDPGNVDLLNQPVLQRRLGKLLGSQYGYIKGIWQVETPMEVDDGLFYASAMQAHSGGDPSAVLMADIKRNTLYVGIRQDHQVQLYAEDGGDVPLKLQAWANEEE